MTPTRHFQWYAVAGYHVVLVAVTVAVTVVAMGLRHAADRRRLIVVNGLMYVVWGASAQLFYWGDAIGMATTDLVVNAGVSIATGLLLFVVAWRDRDDDRADR